MSSQRPEDDLDTQFHAEMNSGDPEWPIIAELIWQRLAIMDRLLQQIAWCVVDDSELPPDLADRR